MPKETPPIPCIFQKKLCTPNCHLYRDNLAFLIKIIENVNSPENNGDKQDVIFATKEVFHREKLEFNLDTLTKLLLKPSSAYHSEGSKITVIFPPDLKKVGKLIWTARENWFKKEINEGHVLYTCKHKQFQKIINASHDNRLKVRP